MLANNLPQAIAALLKDRKHTTVAELEVWLERDLAQLSALAFECHKALTAKTGSANIFITAGNDVLLDYGYSTKNPSIEVIGETHEESIFSAVLDWWEKRENNE